MDNECLLPSIRVGILHAPTFDDVNYLLSVVDSPRLLEKDPTFVIIKPTSGSSYPLLDHLTKHFRFVDPFVPKASDTRWEQLYDEITEYSTHLIVIFRQEDVTFKEYLKQSDRPKRPTQVLMI